MSKKVRVAMLGMGSMGRTHADQLRKMDDVEIAALCALPTDDAVRYNEERGCAYPVYERFQEMLDRVPMDALYVCLPPFAHEGQIEAAAKKGFHIFTEKPLALTLERAESIERAVREAGVKSQMGYHMRFGSAIKRIRELMESGEAGKPTLFTANYQCNSLHVPWWRMRDKSGGQIFEQIIHLYDLSYYFMGEPERVTGFASNLCHRDVPGYTVEDTSAVAIQFKSGALGSITGSNCAVPGLWKGIFKIVFENMVAEAADYNELRITFTKGEIREESHIFEDNVRFDENRRFIDTVKGEAPEIAPISQGLTGLKMVAAAMTSSETYGLPVQL